MTEGEPLVAPAGYDRVASTSSPALRLSISVSSVAQLEHAEVRLTLAVHGACAKRGAPVSDRGARSDPEVTKRLPDRR